MQTADDAVTGAAQVAVTADPDLHHRRVILDRDPPDIRGPHRRNSNRPGIVRVVLVHRAGVEQPHPGGQFGLHVEDLLTGGEQLLSEQATESGSAFDRPYPLGPGRRPGPQVLNLRR